MIRKFLLSALVLYGAAALAQPTDSIPNLYKNAADHLLQQDSKLEIGGYGEVHYNQPLDASMRSNGKLDVHRVVMLFGYNFNERVQFVTELEFEHVQEVYVEQAFLQYKLNRYINFRGGLLLIPMGIINEYHEPTTFNGVERPLIDNTIAPTTWREIGFGVSGSILPASIKYQAYVVNGFNGYDGSPKLNGRSGLRSGRQKGAESYISAPNFSGKIEYYGVRGLNVGVSGYFGKTQSTLYHGVSNTDPIALALADSSSVGVAMIGVDARYSIRGLQLRGQLYHISLSNTEQYNQFTANTSGVPNDLGSAMAGYYIEAGYNILRPFTAQTQLIPFVRYEFLNTHSAVDAGMTQNPKYEKSAITAGLTLSLTNGAVVKADMQLVKDAVTTGFAKTFNAGIGVMF